MTYTTKINREELGLEPFYSIPYKILSINPILEDDYREQIFFRCQSEIFQWANREGLNGRKVFGFKVVKDEDPGSIHYGKSHVWCQIVCTKEEREEWEKLNAI